VKIKIFPLFAAGSLEKFATAKDDDKMSVVVSQDMENSEANLGSNGNDESSNQANVGCFNSYVYFKYKRS